jgi:hypothetical protein
VDLKLLSIKCSGLTQAKSMKIEGLLEENPSGSFVSREELDSWILIEFNQLINPTHYRLDYMDIGFGGPPKNWEIQVIFFLKIHPKVL